MRFNDENIFTNYIKDNFLKSEFCKMILLLFLIYLIVSVLTPNNANNLQGNLPKEPNQIKVIKVQLTNKTEEKLTNEEQRIEWNLTLSKLFHV